jgi:RHS repeat-associated protein
MKQIHQFFLLITALLLSAIITTAEPLGTPDELKAVGAYTEVTEDLKVKVVGGEITWVRSWQGDKHRWLFNPHHEPLAVSDDKEGEAYGYALAGELARGSRKFHQKGQAIFRRSSSSSSGGGGGGGGAGKGSAINVAIFKGIEYCVNEGETAMETIHAAKGGYKWVNQIGRRWAQFSPEGQLIEWGIGNFRIGQLFYQAGKVKGYADTHGTEVITVTRNQDGLVTKVADYTGREVKYSYNAEGQLENVIDPEGVKTHYEYQNGNIVSKTIGDASSASPGDESSEETKTTFGYFPGLVALSFVETPDGNKTTYQYAYNKDDKLYTTTATSNGNVVTKTIKSVDDGTVSVEKNGQYELRVVRLCEDTAIIDRHNGVTYIDRDAVSAVRRVIFPDGRELKFDHSAENWPEVKNKWDEPTKPWGVISVTTPDGRFISYERDPKGNIKTAVEQMPDGKKRYWSFNYDGFGNKTEERLQAGETKNDALDSVKHWSYDAYGNIHTFQVGINGPIWKYEYNSLGQITKLIAPDGEEFKYTYTKKGQIKSFTNPLGYQLAYAYNNRGLLRRVVEMYEAGKEAVTEYRYNHRGLVKKVIDPFAKDWIYEYTLQGELETAIDPLGKKISYQYDAKGRVISSIDGSGVTVSYEYLDTAPPGQAPQIEIPFPPRVLVKYPTYTEDLQYDQTGKLTIDRLVSNDGLISEEKRYEYNLAGQLTAVIRPDGERVEYTWDQLSQLTSIKAPGQGTTNITYSNGERKVTYTDPLGGNIVYDFDDAGRIIKETGVEGKIISYTYDINGNLETVTGGKGELVKLTYDKAQEVKRVETFANASAVTPLRTVSYLRNLRGDLLDIADGTTTQHYDLDPIGRILSATTTYDVGFVKSHSYTYTANGLPQTQTMIDGTTLSYLWDPANRLEGISIPSKGSINFGYSAQEWPDPVSLTFPGGSKQSFEYDALRRLKRIHSTDQVGNSLLDYNYDYQNGPLFGGLMKNLTSQDGDYSYSYDKGARLTNATYPDQTEEKYTYDDLGRRQPADGSMQWGYTKSGAVKNTSNAQFSYDANGNRSSKIEGGVTTEYIYNEHDRLIRIEKPQGNVLAKYTYDSFGRRLSKEVGGTKTYFYYNEDGLAAELDATGAVKKQYLFSPGSFWTTAPLALEQGGTYHFAHSDHLGVPQKLVTAGGAVTWKGKTKPFGETSVVTAAIENPLRLPGQYFDTESGLNHNFQRNYDPLVGAYLEEDPYGAFISGPNRHFYANGNPILFYDPTGQLPEPEEIAEFGVEVVWEMSPLSTGVDIGKCVADHCLYFEECTDAILAVVTFGLGKVWKVYKIGRRIGKTLKALPSPRESLLNSINNPRLRDAIDNLYRKGAQLGNGSSMDALRIEGSHLQKVLDRRKSLMRILRQENLTANERKIVKDVLIDIQDALDKHIGTK